VIAATVVVSAGFITFATWMIIRTQRRIPVSGQEGMIGEVGEALEPIHTRGRFFVHGEDWQACSDQPITAESGIEVIQVLDGLKLKVKAIEAANLTKAIEPKED